jgi:RHS repeat-associated protein
MAKSVTLPSLLARVAKLGQDTTMRTLQLLWVVTGLALGLPEQAMAQTPCSPIPGASATNYLDAGSFTSCPQTKNFQANTTFDCYQDDYTYASTNDPRAQPSPDVYYRFHLSGASQVTVNTCGSDFDTYLHLVALDPVTGATTQVWGDDDSGGSPAVGCAGRTSILSSVPVSANGATLAPVLPATLPAGDYFIVVEGYYTNTGNIQLSLSVTPQFAASATPPSIAILTVPSGQSGIVGTNIDFELAKGSSATLTALGTNVTSYTWRVAKTGALAGSGSSLTVSPTETTTYQVTGTGTNCTGNLTATAQATVRVALGNRNYITTRTAQVAGKTTLMDMLGEPPAEVAVSTTYFDGLGRPMQKVGQAATITQHDLVQPITYDALGRSVHSYLPYPQDINDGQFKVDALAQQLAFYLPTTRLSRTVQDAAPFAVTQYEASPLDRVLEQGAAGKAWQPGTGHTQKFTQRANTADEAVRQWEYDIASQTYTSPGFYPAGQLLVKETRDEQNQLVTEYLDKQGKTILKRVSVAPTVCNLVYGTNQNLSLAVPAGSAASVVLTSIRRAIFGTLTSGSSCADAVFDPSRSVDVTSYVKGLVTLPQASITVPIDYRQLGSDPDPRNVKHLIVEATYAAAGSSTDLLTYYVYDKLDNLRLVISPEGVNTLVASNSWAITDNFIRSWCFRYEYDGRHRVLSKQTPGAQPVLLVYNQRDQVVLTQDGNQNTSGSGEWAFTKYDGLGRPILTGVVSLPGQSQLGLQNQLDNQLAIAEEVDNSPLGYSLTKAFPQNITEANLLSISYYDRYNSQLTTPALQCTLPATQWLPAPRGMLTGSSVRQVAPDGTWGTTWLTSVTYYDKQYRAVQSVAQNQLQGTTTQLLSYNLTKTLTAATTVTQSAGVGYKDSKRFTYYSNGLPKETFQTLYSFSNTSGTTTITAQPEILLAQNTYNELGQLIDKRLHSTDWSLGTASKFLQKVDYRYNIRGWLTHINNRSLTSSLEQSPNVYVTDNSDEAVADPDLFGMELAYNTPQITGTVPQYNGNIAQALWQTRGKTQNNKLRAYTYGYDPANRITGAQYHTNDPGTAGGWDTTPQPVDFSVSNIAYDGNGNLLSMTRQGTISGGDDNPVKGTLDQLTYSYKKMVGGQLVGSNQLLGVDDAVATPGATHDFEDNGSTYNSSAAPEYSYDSNGNLTSDANKGIIAITYTRLNQPAVITFRAMPSTGSAGGTIKYTYSATGGKLTKQVFSGTATTPTKTTQYVGPVVFEQTPATPMTPVFAQTAEGRVLYLPDTNAPLPWKYEYHLKDHLGNLRFAFRADRDNGATQRQAGMELTNAPQEEQQFTHVSETRLLDPDHARTGSYVARLNAGIGRRQGPSIRLNVTAGDSIRAKVYARYDRETGSANLLQRGALVAGATSTNIPSQAGTEQTKFTGNRKNWRPFIGASLGIIPQLLRAKKAKLPTAYLRYEIFTSDSQLITTHIQALRRTATDEWQLLQADTKADSTGFVLVSLVNETDTPAYFDDMALSRVASTPYQENHYDPFGLNLVGIEQADVPNSAFQYNGKEKQEDFGLNWVDYGARMYDAQIGRWQMIDPLAEKMRRWSPYNFCFDNPTRFVDFDGMAPGDTFNEKGKYLRSDGIDDGKIYIEKEGVGGGATSTYEVTHGKTTLKESLNILAKTRSKTAADPHGGLHGESSIVKKDGTILVGASSSRSVGDGKGGAVTTEIMPRNTPQKGDVLIHSHVTDMDAHLTPEGDRAFAFPYVATQPSSPLDYDAFKSYDTNVIVGPLAPGSVSITPAHTDTNTGQPVPARLNASNGPAGAVFYNSQGAEQIRLSEKAIERIVNH